MKIAKYIQELLLENETVIIPGFGAFFSNYKPAEINEETNEIKPPSKVISFNQQIRNNDGLLVGHIADSEGISHFDALKEIEKERENIIYQLDKGEKVTLQNTGDLYYDEKNEIRMESFTDDNLLLDSFGFEAISLDNSIEKTDEQESLKEIVETEEKKRRSWIWYLLILIPVIIAGIFITLNKAKTDEPISEIQTKSITETKTEPEKNAVSQVDSSKTDSTQLTTVDSTETTDPAPDANEILNLDLPKYYLVGGSFKAEKNAEKYLQQLKSEGYEAFHLGKRGNFYIVGIGKYNSRAEATKAKRDYLAKNPGSGIWIKKE